MKFNTSLELTKARIAAGEEIVPDPQVTVRKVSSGRWKLLFNPPGPTPKKGFCWACFEHLGCTTPLRTRERQYGVCAACRKRIALELLVERAVQPDSVLSRALKAKGGWGTRLVGRAVHGA